MASELDFKYVIQDFSNVYIGARLTYEELTQRDDTPQRLKSAVYRYLFETDVKEQRICDRLVQLKKDSAEYTIYMQLRMQIRVVTPVTKVDRKGKQHVEFKTDSYAFSDFMDKLKEENIHADRISEITFKKLHLMSLAV